MKMFGNIKLKLAVVMAMASVQLLAQGHDNNTRVKPGDIFYTEAGTNAKKFVDYKSWNSSLGTAEGIVFYSYYGTRPEAPNAAPAWHGWIVDKEETSLGGNYGGGVSWSLSLNAQNQYPGYNIPNLIDLPNISDAMKDTAGYTNTKLIMEGFRDATDTEFQGSARWEGYQGPHAAVVCYSKEGGTPLTGEPLYQSSHPWYLPALGQLNMLWGQIAVVNTALSESGCGNPIRVDGWRQWWASTEVDKVWDSGSNRYRPHAYTTGPNTCVNTDGTDHYGPHFVRAMRSF